MNIAQIEENLQELMRSFNKETFIYDLLLAYGLPKASITRLQKGALNMSNLFGEVSWKQKVFFKELDGEDIQAVAKRMQQGIKHRQRFIIATNFTSLVAIDTKTEDKLDIELSELPKHFDFFLPWAGMEKATYKDDNPADIKAAEKMAKLFDVIKRDNPDDSPEFGHGLNVFLSRLLFCFFADDTGIFTDNQVTNAIASHTQQDGSDLDAYLSKLFDVLDTEENERGELPSHLSSFPYVNGSLFKERFVIPKFSRRSRQAIIDSGEMDWSEINPDIFGSMFQAVISVDQRGSLGQHYTSVPNIMKVIEPLFLNDLYEAFEKAKGDKTKLSLLLQRLHKIKIFDPACGSGNFLIIAYKEMRRLEMKIFKESGVMPLSGIHLSQFYGIELDDFAHEIAQLALWLAEHQMNVESSKTFGKSNPTLPLGDSAQITLGNACRLSWYEVCPKESGDEIYILGNPPYLGARQQSKEQKSDVSNAMSLINGHKNLDYISVWFYKSSRYIKGYNAKVALVSTNSVVQGEQVSTLWSPVFEMELEIHFAHQSFRWSNNAKSNAAVTCVIVGIRNNASEPKFIYNEGLKTRAKNINAYLVDASNFFVVKRRKPISNFQPINYGSFALDDGNYTLSEKEKDEILAENPDAKKYIKEFIGAKELLQGGNRYCLWLTSDDVLEHFPSIQYRVEQVRKWRSKSDRINTFKLSKTPKVFAEIRQPNKGYIAFPTVSSERRSYVPLKYLEPEVIASNQLYIVPNAEYYLMSILFSRMHNVWIKSVGGKMKTDYRYSAAICYNNFPFPPISSQRSQELTQSLFNILREIEKFSEKTLAQLYDPEKMPEGLREAHRLNDMVIERCYRSRPFESDEERLEYLFKLYEKMIEDEKNKGGLFEKPKKTRKKKSNA